MTEWTALISWEGTWLKLLQDLDFIVKSSKSTRNASEDWQRISDRGLIYVYEDIVHTLNSIELVIKGKEDASEV